MKREQLNFDGCYLLNSTVYPDSRGYFLETYNRLSFIETMEFDFKPVQMNVSTSKIGVVRGIHFSLSPMGQRKLVTCLSGSINDYIVDLRVNSSTFGQWEKITLIAGMGDLVFIPSGFGHAFQSLREDTIVAYHLDTSYSPNHEKSISILDADIALEFEIPIGEISDKDKDALTIAKMKTLKQLPM